ncbi:MULTISPECIES: hypothetical protein [Pseudoalteromonas]|uniref:Uncharacterized protein n=1 Tax=Pseudoalteromonas luteoviolacea (strain 2ta16) TaxID=1353533 RepID=V4JJC3_PSEL2|nr:MULTISPECIES: hypothetical protein [Pseudoalteromonas]ESP94972.1 hypothetical protein PL2TA16_04528 [Pseudoalteromonas luteoviolacea 2ta16]KZN36303.1 hypothetical protein N483_22595 [Pseudoalteromonas luteoviolacea NCIMB 1944]MCG7550141.1 hypothetical protein [Pseudoalteromonas sp. Of7M-16]
MNLTTLLTSPVLFSSASSAAPVLFDTDGSAGQVAFFIASVIKTQSSSDKSLRIFTPHYTDIVLGQSD